MERTVETTQNGWFSLDSERTYAKRYLAPRTDKEMSIRSRRNTKIIWHSHRNRYTNSPCSKAVKSHWWRRTDQLKERNNKPNIIPNLLASKPNTSLIHLLITSHPTFNNIGILFLSLCGRIVHFVKTFPLVFGCQATASEMANCNSEQHQKPNRSNRSIPNQVTSSSQDCLTNNAAYNAKRRSTTTKEITSHKLNVFYNSF